MDAEHQHDHQYLRNSNSGNTHTDADCHDLAHGNTINSHSPASYANADANSHPNPDTNANSHPYADTDADSHAYADPNPNAVTYSSGPAAQSFNPDAGSNR
jgi:hypothetical protein